jgi:YebC/PmpR family DNA-binding regulatory protein
MSGHSKWANIKHRKGRQDAKRGKLFAKLVRAVEAAAREGGGDPVGNPSLATAIQKAKEASVSRDNIDRAVARGSGATDGVQYEEIWYEGYGPGGVAVYVRALTGNRNRAASDVRAAFSRNNGSLGEPGSVAYLFEQKGYVLARGEEDPVLLAALEAGAEDVTESGDQWEIVSPPGALENVRDTLESMGIEVDQAEVTQMPTASVPIGAENAPAVLQLVDSLEDLDDVMDVFANFDIPDDVLATIG